MGERLLYKTETLLFINIWKSNIYKFLVLGRKGPYNDKEHYASISNYTDET